MIRTREIAPVLQRDGSPTYQRVLVSAADQKAADEELAKERRELARKNELRRLLSHPIINLPAMTG